jgi:hypothetical protein
MATTLGQAVDAFFQARAIGAAIGAPKSFAEPKISGDEVEAVVAAERRLHPKVIGADRRSQPL